MRRRHRQLRCDESRLGSGGEGLGALAIRTSLGAVSAADREAALWEMEEHHLQERHQLVKQQLKDQYFLQRHELLRKHEKVRLRARASRAAPGGREAAPGGREATPRISERSRLATGRLERFSAMSCLRSRGQESWKRPP